MRGAVGVSVFSLANLCELETEMTIPRCLREQAKFYASKGFHMIDAEPRSGAHFLVKFAEFPDPVIVSKNGSDGRAVHNNVSAYRRLKEKHDGTNT
jgi:hypothetical protein